MPVGAEHTIIVYDPGDLIDQRFRDAFGGGATLDEGDFFTRAEAQSAEHLVLHQIRTARTTHADRPGPLRLQRVRQLTEPNYVGVSRTG